jgi:hypothetical protein
MEGIWRGSWDRDQSEPIRVRRRLEEIETFVKCIV